MRHPFYMDHLGHQERRKVRQLLLRIFVVYLSLTVNSCRRHNVHGKIRSASRPDRPERRCPLIDLIARGHAAPLVLTGI